MYEYCMEDEGVWLAYHIERFRTEKVNTDRLYGLSHLVYEPLWNKIKFSQTIEELTMYLRVSKSLEKKLEARFEEDSSLVKPFLYLLIKMNHVQWQLQKENEAYESIQKAMNIFDRLCNEVQERVLLSQLLERVERTASLDEGAGFFLNIVKRRYHIWENVLPQTIIEKREKASAQYRMAFYLFFAEVKDNALLLELCHQALQQIQAPLPEQPEDSAFMLSSGEKLVAQEDDNQNLLLGITLALVDNDGLKNKEPETLILASQIYRLICDIFMRMESQKEADTANGYATLFEKQALKLTGGDLACGKY